MESLLSILRESWANFPDFHLLAALVFLRILWIILRIRWYRWDVKVFKDATTLTWAMLIVDLIISPIYFTLSIAFLGWIAFSAVASGEETITKILLATWLLIDTIYNLSMKNKGDFPTIRALIRRVIFGKN